MTFTLTWETLSYMIVVLGAVQALVSWTLSSLFVRQSDCSKHREECHRMVEASHEETDEALKNGSLKFATLEVEHRQIFGGMQSVGKELGELKQDLKERMDRLEKILMDHIVQG
ncbi:hypothetical protein Mmc1_1688 [Magnetococcus marinus MC-1]|uniref:Uncharacterized protein n=1 Tax=Magnetococcus marinus (strain ATCC BAA-1437 / JCM 17883 / MC-1) TaxID=156889 RepID=A0L8A4_MAGMM|nr:hypothetical protein [Magnetococcus marinus]ABK44197.1 hypothetical protein Mmc1_1688 [Magnetococcus marinus MC-1]